MRCPLLVRRLYGMGAAGLNLRPGRESVTGMWHRRSVLGGLGAVGAGLALPALAQFRVEIAGVGATQIPVAVARFRDEAAGGQPIAAIVRANLERSGLFRGVDAPGALDETARPVMAEWRARAADALVAGSLTRLADGRFDVRYKLWDVVQGEDLGGQSQAVVAADLRLAAHRISDAIFRQLTGEPGVFATRVAYVTRSAGRFSLIIADADGEGAQVALASPEPIISPAWSPDGRQLAYVSFETQKAVVWVQEVASGRRRMLANFRGSNSAPAWSPDGAQLALTLSRDGGSRLFLLSAAGGEPRRTLTFRAPTSGVVLERKAVQGMRFATGEPLLTIADLSRVWLIAEVAEQDIGRVRIGTPARVRLEAYPGETFDGRVSFVLPTLQAATRSAQVRIELANADGRLKPDMFAQVDLPLVSAPQLVLPNAAIIDSGTRRVALVDMGAGRFESREIETGARGDEFTVVKRGLREGDSVVVSANFLLDSEANLRAALAALKGGSNTNPEPVPVVHEAVGTLDEVDARAGTLLITHEPVKSLNWPTMTMEFVPANSAVAQAVQPGAAIRFEFVERKPGEWVVTKMEKREPTR